MSDWEGILHAVQVSMGGDRSRGKELLEACWTTAHSDDHAQRCVVAHYLADLQDDLDDEIRWDAAALSEYRHVGGTDLAAVGISSAAGLAPSLHLNLGDGYARRGDLSAARRELDAGLACVAALGDDGYGTFIRKGLAGLAERLNKNVLSGAHVTAPTCRSGATGPC
jgi:hypothetical protein